MKYMVDHQKRQVHLTPFIGDICKWKQTRLESREGTHDLVYINDLVDHKGYKKCPHCFIEFPSVKVLEKKASG